MPSPYVEDGRSLAENFLSALFSIITKKPLTTEGGSNQQTIYVTTKTLVKCNSVPLMNLLCIIFVLHVPVPNISSIRSFYLSGEKPLLFLVFFLLIFFFFFRTAVLILDIMK